VDFALRVFVSNCNKKPNTMTHTEKVIHALKIVIGSYEFAAATGQPRRLYIMNETGGASCPVCDVIDDCEECPCGNGHDNSCTLMANFIWNRETPDRDKALRRAAELRAKLAELEIL
jgi:hypothetical protein